MNLPLDCRELELNKRGLTTRIAVISPSDSVNDDEYNNYLPPGVTLLWTRYETPAANEPISVKMVGTYGDLNVIRAQAEMMRITRPHVTVFCCNSCSFVHGLEIDQRIRDTITAAAGSPATSITNAQVEALRILGVKRVAVVAPYRPEVTEKLIQYLHASEFIVTRSTSRQFISEWEIGNATPSVWYELAQEVNTSDAEAVLLACSGIRASDILDRLEADLGKPVVSAPAAVIWHALRLVGLDWQMTGRGRLFRVH